MKPNNQIKQRIKTLKTDLAKRINSMINVNIANWQQ